MAANVKSANPNSAKAKPLPGTVFSFAVFHFRRHSLLRANLLVLGSFAASFWLSGFPRTRATPLLAIPAVLAFLGLIETVRCVQPRWNLYHFGILLLLLMDMMVLCLILFFLFFPYLV
jgi:hypothetical protein